MKGKQKKLWARIISFLLCVILVIPELPMREVRAEDHFCPNCMQYEDTDYCLFCGFCDSCCEICDRCGEVCLNCHEILEGSGETSPCSECGRCKEGVDYCQFCGRCEDCIELCDHCGELCLECHDTLGGEGEYEPCSDCGRCKENMDYCLFCGRCADCVDICSECGEICTECHEELAGESVDEYVPCPGCYRCKAGGLIYCHECGYCEDCKEFCYGCGMCMDCAMEQGNHCVLCENCFEMTDKCESDGDHCVECCELCETCGLCFIAMDMEPCDFCGLCEECCECSQCDACGMCVEDPLFDEHFCEECGACMIAEEEQCDTCGLCLRCCIEKAEDMGCFCESGCWMDLEDDHFCADCGRCFGEVDLCNTCFDAGEYRCIDCCAELAELEGCDCADPVCINADDFASHMSSVHGGATQGHSITPKTSWTYDETYHWHDCRLCDETKHISDKGRHSFNSKGICTVCGFNSTSEIVITSQPKDRNGKPTYDGWTNGHYDLELQELARDNTVMFTVAAYGRDAKKGLHYQWYMYYGAYDNKYPLHDEDSNDYQYYISGSNTSTLTYAVPFDGCGCQYGFYCKISDDYGNEVNSQAAFLHVSHDCRAYDSRECTSDAKGHTFVCVGGGCSEQSSKKPHTYGEYKIGSNAGGEYLYHECTVCGWREVFKDHLHQYDFGELIEHIYADNATEVVADDKHHIYEYEYMADNGKVIRARLNPTYHSISCSVDGCTFKSYEKHDWGSWHLVNNATEKRPGGLWRSCNICGIQQDWSTKGYKWHTHPINIERGKAKQIDSRVLTTTDTAQLARLLEGLAEQEDLDIAGEGDVVLLLPSAKLDQMVTGAKVTIQCKTGLNSSLTHTETLDVTELVPGVAYAFTVPTSGTRQVGKNQIEKVDYEASFIEVEFTYTACSHKRTKTKDEVNATCTESGYSGDTVCAYCEHLITKGHVTAPKGHGEGVPATENVPSLNVKGEQIYYYMDQGNLEIPLYKIHMAEEINCDDWSMRGSYTGDLICPDCGELMQKGKYYEKNHDYCLYNDWDANTQRLTLDPSGCKPYVAPAHGEDGYSGDSMCTVCGKISWGHVLKSQEIKQVFIEISEMPTYGSTVNYDVFTYSEGTKAGSEDMYYLSWFGYKGFAQYEWNKAGERIDEKIEPALTEFELRVAPKEGYWFRDSIDEMQIFVNGKQIRENNESFGFGRAIRLDLIKDSTASDYGELAISVSMAMTGFCGVAYDVNGGEGNIACPAVARGTEVSLVENSFVAPSGMKFDHWEIDGKAYQPGDKIIVNGLVIAKAVWKEVVPFKLAGASMNLGNSLDMLFLINKADVTETDCYATIRKVNAGKDDTVKTIQFSEWYTYGPYYLLQYDELTAMEMNDKFYVQVFHADGTPASEAYEDSVADYALRGFNELPEAEKRLSVDLLFYGAAAQKTFGYDVEHLVSDRMTDAQKAYGTVSVSGENKREDKAYPHYAGTSLDLQSRIQFYLFFNDVPRDGYAKISFTNHNGTKVESTVAGSDSLVASATMSVIVVNELTIPDARKLVTCEVYDKDGNLLDSVTDSIESYVFRGTTGEIDEAVLKFADSAYNYFHP